MNKSIASICGILGILASCANNSSTDEIKQDDLNDFIKNFAAQISGNNIDSLKLYYPDIVLADSLKLVNPIDSVFVTETTPQGDLIVNINPVTSLIIYKNEKGQIRIKDSYGLFAYSPTKEDIAIKSGMWEDNMKDVELAKRINDKDFYSYLIGMTKEVRDSMLTVGPQEWEDFGFGFQLITNNTDQDIYSTDYTIDIEEEGKVYNVATGGYEEWKAPTKNKPGLPIAPHESVKVEINGGSNGGSYVSGVHLNISDQDYLERFFKFTGKEYQQYLDSKSE